MAVFIFQTIPERLTKRIKEFDFKRVGLHAVKGAITFSKGAGTQVLKSVLFAKKATFFEEPDLQSYLGTPVYANLVFQHGNYFELKDINQTNAIPYDGLVIQTVLIEVTQTKNIITTAMQGKDGTVKEYISMGDYAATLTGGIIGECDYEYDEATEKATGGIKDIGNYYPHVDVRKLKDICEAPIGLTITSEFLNMFEKKDRTTWVITDYSIPQREATRDMQPFQISMLSDFPIELNELEVTP